jgi:hypothetical protein
MLNAVAEPASIATVTDCVDAETYFGRLCAAVLTL